MSKPLILILLTYCFSCFSSENDKWIDQVSNRVDQDAVNWLKEHLQEKKASVPQMDRAIEKAKENLESLSKVKCQNCLEGKQQDIEDPYLFVFMSFSIPDAIWISLSPALEKAKGVFVLRGVPGNRFKDLAGKILSLKQQGVNATIQLNPNFFQKYEVDQVPCFVITDADKFDKVSGNISLEFAIDLMANQGETVAAKKLKEEFKRGSK